MRNQKYKPENRLLCNHVTYVPTQGYLYTRLTTTTIYMPVLVTVAATRKCLPASRHGLRLATRHIALQRS